GLNLERENKFESVIVSGRGQYRRIRRERERGQPWAFRLQPHDQFGGDVQGVGSATAVSKKNELASGTQRGCGLLRKLRDPADQFAGKTLLDASAFLELAANLFHRPGHRCLAENDFFAVTHHEKNRSMTSFAASAIAA